MTYRSVASILFAIIIAAELFFYLSFEAPTPTIETTTVEQEPSDGKRTSFFSSLGNRKTITETSTDYTQQQNRNYKYLTMIGATLVVGAVVVFSVPNKPLKKSNKPNPLTDAEIKR